MMVLEKHVQEQAPLRCPKCGSTDIAQIIYDPPTLSDEILQKVQAKKAIIRLDAPSARRARYHCNYCQYEW